MKRIFCSFLLFLFASVLQAETEMRLRNLESRLCFLEQERQVINPLYDPITPNAGPRVCNGLDMFVTTDFLYWTARLDTLTYSSGGFGSLLDVCSPGKGQIYSVDWEWDPGFKLGYGWTFCHGGWDLYLQYTWFYTSANDATRAGNLQFPLFSFSISDKIGVQVEFLGSMERAHADWDLHYQVGDLELGRNYYIDRYLKLRPFIGVRGTWQKQDYSVCHEALPLRIIIRDPNPDDIIDLFSDFQSIHGHRLWGIGARAGLNTAWHFCSWLSLYGDFALSGVWTHYSIDRKDTLEEIETDNIMRGERDLIKCTIINVGDTLRMVKPAFEFAMGLRAESYFYCNRLHAQFQAGWETQIWLNQTLHVDLLKHYHRFDLTLQGLTVKFRLDF